MNLSEQRPTPETDAQERIIPSRLTPDEFDQQHGEWVPADFARNLERERDEAREQLEAMREAIESAAKALRAGLYKGHDAEKRSQAALAKLQPFLKP